MLTLSREGDLTSESKGIVDSLRMTYDGMLLAAAHDYAAVPSVATSMDFRDGASADVEYTYDACGRLISDLNKGIASISYDAVGQPAFINAGDHAELSYYLPDGTKVRRTEAESDGRFLSQPKTTDYRSNAVYVDGDLHYLLTDSGLIGFAPLGAEYLHFVKDHLGNVRAVATSDGLVVQGNQYYPFGMSFATNKPVNELTEEHSYIDLNGNVIGGGDAGGFIPGGGALSGGEGVLIPQAALLLAGQPYRFGGKELYSSTGTYDFLARQYDPALCRFTTPDPLAAKYPSISPYAYCGNDPVNKVDPDGKKIYFAAGTSEEFKQKFAATVQYMNEKGTSKQLAQLDHSSTVYYISDGRGTKARNQFNAKTLTISWDPDSMFESKEGIFTSSITILCHEIDHANQYDKSPDVFIKNNQPNSDEQFGTKEERRACENEQKTAEKHGEVRDGQKVRNSHSGGCYISNRGASPDEQSKACREHNDMLLQ